MKLSKPIILLLLLLIHSCITPFVPEIERDKELMVVEGLITDQPRTNTIKLSKSLALWKSSSPTPLKGCTVWISDNLDNVDSLKEISRGTYVTDSLQFKGEIGRQYTLHIITAAAYGNLSYESDPIEMKPVPPLDVCYEKELFIQNHQTIEGCQFYLDTYDPTNSCKFYRWEYSETWEFHLPYDVPNRVCWISNNSDEILIKNTSVLNESRINRFPFYFISNPIDRLEVKYSILVNQYSLNEGEYLYWERLQNMKEQSGGLYDIMPATIPSNIHCLDNPLEKVLGYFSVSAMSSKRVFIKDFFSNPPANGMYNNCPFDTIYGDTIIGGNLGSFLWVIIEYPDTITRIRILTNKRDCADCRVRGTDIEPDFWNDDQ